jgi:hypothetical protein
MDSSPVVVWSAALSLQTMLPRPAFCPYALVSR